MKYVGRTVLVILIGGVLLTLRQLTLNYQKNQSKANESELVIKNKVVSSSQEQSQKEQAIASLERPKESIKGERETLIKESLNVAMTYLMGQSNVKTVEVSYSNRLSLTQPLFAQTLVSLMLAGYRYDEDSVLVYQSNAENVYQFILDLVKEGEEIVSVAGNYVVGTSQIELVNFYGLPKHVENQNMEEN